MAAPRSSDCPGHAHNFDTNGFREAIRDELRIFGKEILESGMFSQLQKELVRLRENVAADLAQQLHRMKDSNKNNDGNFTFNLHHGSISSPFNDMAQMLNAQEGEKSLADKRHEWACRNVMNGTIAHEMKRQRPSMKDLKQRMSVRASTNRKTDVGLIGRISQAPRRLRKAHQRAASSKLVDRASENVSEDREIQWRQTKIGFQEDSESRLTQLSVTRIANDTDQAVSSCTVPDVSPNVIVTTAENGRVQPFHPSFLSQDIEGGGSDMGDGSRSVEPVEDFEDDVIRGHSGTDQKHPSCRPAFVKQRTTDVWMRFIHDSQDELEKSTKLSGFVRSLYFDYLFSGLVIVNAIVLGVLTDWQARNVTKTTPPALSIVERVFFCIFALELGLRAYVYRWEFFNKDQVYWNFFDTFLVLAQFMEELLSLISLTFDDSDQETSKYSADNLTVMRLLRIMRLIRVMRLMRVLRLISELRTMVMSIIGSLRSLVWAIILLFVMMFVIGVYLTQLVLEHRVRNSSGDVPVVLGDAFGSLGDTIYSLYCSVTGGTDWADLADPLRDEISVWLGPLYMLYIAFALLCILNVITGVFVESALLTARKDKEVVLINHIKTLFSTCDVNHSGEVTWDEFEQALEKPEMKEVFKEIEIDISEARGLFHLLDLGDHGTINAADFINGCHRLHGPAKALDLTLLMREMTQLSDHHFTHVKNIETVLFRLTEIMQAFFFILGGNDLRSLMPPVPGASPAPPTTLAPSFSVPHTTLAPPFAVDPGSLVIPSGMDLPESSVKSTDASDVKPRRLDSLQVPSPHQRRTKESEKRSQSAARALKTQQSQSLSQPSASLTGSIWMTNTMLSTPYEEDEV